MIRSLSLGLAFLTACAVQPTAPSAVPSAVQETVAAVEAVPCAPANAILGSTLWVQSSAEYRASTMQTYAAARRMLDAALADKTWTAEPQQAAPFDAKPPAVILDLDETVIDNSDFEARVIRQGRMTSAMWDGWVNEAASGAVPGALEFLAYAKSRGVTPFYITNRDANEEPGTRRNLEKLGVPMIATEDAVLTRGERGEGRVSDKGPRRASVAERYRVLLLLGDDLNDFVNAREKNQEEREHLISANAARWGTQWFILPNPIYGSWERSLYGSNSSLPPCEQLQKRLDALKP